MTMSVKEAAAKYQVSAQAIFIAIKNDRLKAVKPDGVHWAITEEDLKSYRSGLYSRKHMRYNGELVYPPDKGLLSLREAAEMISVPENKIYYAVYRNRIKYSRVRSAYIFRVEDVIDFAKNFVGVKSNG
jgi:excisionase family DNA binding protein